MTASTTSTGKRPPGLRAEARWLRARQRVLAATNLRMSLHADLRASELGFSVEEVAACVKGAEQSYCSHHAYGPGRRTYQRGPIAVVVEERTRTVVTVLLRQQRQWKHGCDTRTSGVERR